MKNLFIFSLMVGCFSSIGCVAESPKMVSSAPQSSCNYTDTGHWRNEHYYPGMNPEYYRDHNCK